MMNGIEGVAGAKGPRGVTAYDYTGLCLPRLRDLREQFESSREIVERVINMPYAQYKALYEEEIRKEEAYEAALEKGFQGSFLKFKYAVQDENGVDGWLGIAYRQMYEDMVKEGFYCGTYEEFLKFKERCYWLKNWVPINPTASKFFDFTPIEPSEQELKEQYQKVLGMYYRGTFESFKKFRDEYTLGYCGPKGPTGPSGIPGPRVVFECNKTEESPIQRGYKMAVQTGGFQGSFEEYGKMMEGRPRGSTGQSAGPGLVGYSQSSTFIMDEAGFLKLDKKEQLNHMYERAISEDWYKGTLDDFRKFEDRSHWVPYGKFNKDVKIHLDESQLQRKRESYELALKLFYQGTLEDFLLFTANYCWGPVRKDTYID